jgi:cytochrome c oxidase subunit 1
MFMSLLGFGFLGGISGVIMGTEQLNLIIHNTIYVPGHFHATVVIGTTLAFMAVTYFVIPAIFRRELSFPKLAQWQPYLFCLGMTMVSVFMMGAGTLGVPRRHWDITFAGNTLGYEFPGVAHLMMALMGLGGLLAVIGGAIYLLVVVHSVFLGKRIATPDFKPVRLVEGMAAVPMRPAGAALQAHGGVHAWAAPGTFTLAMVFLTTFVLYYFINWKYLSTVWPLK